MNELLLINEVREYIESEREKRKATAEKNFEDIIPAENEIEKDITDNSLLPHDNMIAQDS